MARAAEQHIGSFRPAELLKFLRSYEWINGKDESLTRTVTLQHECRYVFPAVDLTGPDLTAEAPTAVAYVSD